MKTLKMTKYRATVIYAKPLRCNMADTQDYLTRLVKEAADTITERNLKSILTAIICASTESEVLTIDLVYGKRLGFTNRSEGELELAEGLIQLYLE